MNNVDLNIKKYKFLLRSRTEFLKRGNTNIITVDWIDAQEILIPISPVDYFIAKSKVPEVGKTVAKMIQFLEVNGVNLNTTLLVGHSLGAHVMGVAGYQLKPKINYIIGKEFVSSPLTFNETYIQFKHLIQKVLSVGTLTDYLRTVSYMGTYREMLAQANPAHASPYPFPVIRKSANRHYLFKSITNHYEIFN